ncbi:MAG: hypothetical protein ACQES4_11415 [Bacillota bacterium]
METPVGGVYGKILEIDLSSWKQYKTAIDEQSYQNYLEGSGLAACIYDQRGCAGLEPLPETPEIIGFVQ